MLSRKCASLATRAAARGPGGRPFVRVGGAVACARRVHQQPAAGPRPQHVGILAMDVYFPQRCVSQKDLEVADGVSEGKYRIGLGQERMAFVGDREDVNSIAMSAVYNLLSKYRIDAEQIGRLEVGTETLIDKSKSTKTHIMELLGANSNVEGVTCINACYGGTAALLNSVAWIESSAWDGRYAVVVCGDIAVYAAGPARPTGGAGAVAMLIGPDAPLPLSHERHSHAEHCWDFYKPEMHSEYPAVDGHLSNTIYLRSVDVCYNHFLGKTTPDGSVRTFDYMCFHSPYNKLVVKSVGRLLYNDYVRSPDGCAPELSKALGQWHPDSVAPSTTYADRGLDTALKKLSADVYNAKCAPSAALSKEIGNSYTGALWMNLVSLVHNVVRAAARAAAHAACVRHAARDDRSPSRRRATPRAAALPAPPAQRSALEGKRVFMFSYGSGSVATAFAIYPRAPSAAQNPAFTCQAIAETIDLQNRLSSRAEMSPAEFTAALLLRETTHGAAPYVPIEPVETVTPGAFYIHEINSAHHRVYVQRPIADEVRRAARHRGWAKRRAAPCAHRAPRAGARRPCAREDHAQKPHPVIAVLHLNSPPRALAFSLPLRRRTILFRRRVESANWLRNGAAGGRSCARARFGDHSTPFRFADAGRPAAAMVVVADSDALARTHDPEDGHQRPSNLRLCSERAGTGGARMRLPIAAGRARPNSEQRAQPARRIFILCVEPPLEAREGRIDHGHRRHGAVPFIHVLGFAVAIEPVVVAVLGHELLLAHRHEWLAPTTCRVLNGPALRADARDLVAQLVRKLLGSPVARKQRLGDLDHRRLDQLRTRPPHRQALGAAAAARFVYVNHERCGVVRQAVVRRAQPRAKVAGHVARGRHELQERLLGDLHARAARVADGDSEHLRHLFAHRAGEIFHVRVVHHLAS